MISTRFLEMFLIAGEGGKSEIYLWEWFQSVFLGFFKVFLEKSRGETMQKCHPLNDIKCCCILFMLHPELVGFVFYNFLGWDHCEFPHVNQQMFHGQTRPVLRAVKLGHEKLCSRFRS